MNELDLLHEEAHKDYEERKVRLLDNLYTLASNLRTDPSIPDSWVYWIEYAIKFINEKEI